MVYLVPCSLSLVPSEFRNGRGALATRLWTGWLAGWLGDLIFGCSDDGAGSGDGNGD